MSPGALHSLHNYVELRDSFLAIYVSQIIVWWKRLRNSQAEVPFTFLVGMSESESLNRKFKGRFLLAKANLSVNRMRAINVWILTVS